MASIYIYSLYRSSGNGRSVILKCSRNVSHRKRRPKLTILEEGMQLSRRRSETLQQGRHEFLQGGVHVYRKDQQIEGSDSYWGGMGVRIPLRQSRRKYPSLSPHLRDLDFIKWARRCGIKMTAATQITKSGRDSQTEQL